LLFSRIIKDQFTSPCPLSLDHKVLETCRGLCILQTVRYVGYQLKSINSVTAIVHTIKNGLLTARILLNDISVSKPFFSVVVLEESLDLGDSRGPIYKSLYSSFKYLTTSLCITFAKWVKIYRLTIFIHR